MKRIIFLAAIAASTLTPAGAASITIMPALSILAGMNARDAWIAANFGPGATPQSLENFETFGYGPYDQLNTGLGQFSTLAGGLPSTTLGTGFNEFTVLNASDTPFSGRFNTTPGGSNWLDSNDITKLQLSTSLSAVYFFITDVNDIDGTLQIKTADGTSSTGFAPRGSDGNLYFVGIVSSSPIGTIQWLNSSQNDGFGLDDFGTVKGQFQESQVPEPANWWLAGTGLIAILAITWGRRRSCARA